MLLVASCFTKKKNNKGNIFERTINSHSFNGLGVVKSVKGGIRPVKRGLRNFEVVFHPKSVSFSLQFPPKLSGELALGQIP